MIKKIKSVIEFELTTNKHLWKLAQIYTNKIKPSITYHYANLFKKKIKFNIKPLTTLKDTKLQITISTTCDANCVFCAYKYFKNKGLIMSFSMFKKMIDDFSGSGGRYVDLIPTFGENFVNKDFNKMINYAKSKNLFVTIFTNGIKLNKNNNYKKLVNANPDFIYISVGDINPKLDAEIYNINVKSSQERWKGIFKLINYISPKNKEKIKIGFRAKRLPFEIKKEVKFQKIVKKLGKQGVEFTLKYNDFTGLIKEDNLLGIMSLNEEIKILPIPCKMLCELIAFPDGSIRICRCINTLIYDELLIGNVNNNSLLELINSKKVLKLRQSFLKNNPPKICKNCSHYKPQM